MRVTVMHNPKAGRGSPSAEALRAEIEAAGHQVIYRSTKRKGFARALQEPSDLVVAAGGDGTVAKVARAVLNDRSREVPLPVAILPLGRANNIATALGIEGSPGELARRWGHWRHRRIDLWRMRSVFGEDSVLEGVGLGLFARMMARVKRGGPVSRVIREADGFEPHLRLLRSMLHRLQPVPVTLALDGQDCSGRFLLLEALNMPRIGPRLELAPSADPGDGQLDVVMVTEDERDLLDAHLAATQEGRTPPLLRVRRAQSVRLEWTGQPMHRDGKRWPSTRRRKSATEARWVTLDARPKCLAILAP